VLVESVQLKQRIPVLLSGKVNLAVQIHAWLRRDMLLVSLAWKLSCWNKAESGEEEKDGGIQTKRLLWDEK